MKTSEQIGQLFDALSKAQGEFVNPERNRTVKVTTKAKEGRAAGSYTFDYATFDAILASTRPILAKYGLAVVQGVSTEANKVTVTTRIGHASGEWIEDHITGQADAADLQAIGSATTYLKRYSYTALLNIAAEEDDDGNAGAGNEAERTEKQKPACPKCGKNTFVYANKPEQGPGWFCWLNKDKGKLGCGHKWTETEKPEPPAELTDDERAYVHDAQMEIVGAGSEEELMSLGEEIKKKSAAVQNALRGLFRSRLEVLKGQSAAA